MPAQEQLMRISHGRMDRSLMRKCVFLCPYRAQPPAAPGAQRCFGSHCSCWLWSGWLHANMASVNGYQVIGVSVSKPPNRMYETTCMHAWLMQSQLLCAHALQAAISLSPAKLAVYVATWAIKQRCNARRLSAGSIPFLRAHVIRQPTAPAHLHQE